MPSQDFINRVNFLKFKRDHTDDPKEKRSLQRKIDRILDRENARLDKLIMESVARIEKELEKWDERYKLLPTTTEKK
jgi:hypothetical protein